MDVKHLELRVSCQRKDCVPGRPRVCPTRTLYPPWITLRSAGSAARSKGRTDVEFSRRVLGNDNCESARSVLSVSPLTLRGEDELDPCLVLARRWKVVGDPCQNLCGLVFQRRVTGA